MSQISFTFQKNKLIKRIMNNAIDFKINYVVILPKPLNRKSYILIGNIYLVSLFPFIVSDKWLNFTRYGNAGISSMSSASW